MRAITEKRPEYATRHEAIIEPRRRRTHRALEKGEKFCPLFKIEVKKKVVKAQNKKI